MATTWLTDALVRDIRPPASGYRITYDGRHPKHGQLTGFGIRVTKAGARSFILTYRLKDNPGIERRLTIGQWPVWSVTAARDEARELKLRIAKGGDPLGDLEQARGQMTVAELCDRFITEHASRKRPNTRKDYILLIDGIIRPAFGRRHVAAVTHSDIAKLHHEVSLRAPIRANRTVALLSTMFGLAMKWGACATNPCPGIERNTEGRRQRYLREDELNRLIAALQSHPDQQVANILRLCLLTGCRKHEALSATWNQFDLQRGVWTKPASTTKQKTTHTAPLNAVAVALLADLHHDRDTSSDFVFPGRPGTHRADIKKNWMAITEAAQITDLHMHDLRHSFASELVSTGHSLPVIGALLGHSHTATTQRYAHLYDAALRTATDSVGAKMAGIIGKPPRKGTLKAVP